MISEINSVDNNITGDLSNIHNLISDFQEFCGHSVQEAKTSANSVMFYDQINLY